MLVYGLGSIAQSAAAFILIPLYTRHFSLSDYGAFSLLMLLGTVFGGIFYLGVASALPRSYFDYVSAYDRKVTFSTSFYLLCLGGAAQIAIAFIAQEQLSALLLSSIEYSDMVFLTLVSSACTFISYLFYTYMRLKRRSYQVIIFSLGTLTASTLTVYYFVAVLDEGVLGAIKGQLFVQIGLLLIMVIMFARETLILAFNIHEARIQLVFGAGVVLSTFAGLSNQWVGQFFIEKYLTLSDVGTFALGAKLASLINIVLVMPMIQIWNPMMMEYRSSVTIKELFSAVLFLYIFIGVFIVLSTTLFIAELLPVVIGQNDYLGSTRIIPVIMFGILIYGTVNIFSAGLLYERKTFKMALSHYVGAVTNVALCYFLVPLYGIWAVVFITTFVYSMAPIVVYSLSRKYFCFNIKWSRLFKVIALGALVVLIDAHVNFQETYFRLVFKVSLLALFIIATYPLILEIVAKTTVDSASGKRQ